MDDDFVMKITPWNFDTFFVKPSGRSQGLENNQLFLGKILEPLENMPFKTFYSEMHSSPPGKQPIDPPGKNKYPRVWKMSSIGGYGVILE